MSKSLKNVNGVGRGYACVMQAKGKVLNHYDSTPKGCVLQAKGKVLNHYDSTPKGCVMQ